MYMNNFQLDTNHFLTLNSTRTLPNVGVSVSTNTGISVSPLENIEPVKKLREKRLLETSNGTVKKFGVIHKQSRDKANDSAHKNGFGKQALEQNPDRQQRKMGRNNYKTMNNKSLGVKFHRINGNDSVDKVRTKCSTKWVNYGGSIPSILEALETIKNLDEALKPWEDTLSNKERSIILKEQCSWERAMEIFEWFKSRGCYELNVIHYNIMIRILGKAKQWRYLECLCNEMSFKRISPINSTYGTLIDVYSKGGLREKALDWLEKMNKQGMEPDEVTMGIVVQMYKKAGEFQKAEEFFKKWSLREALRHKVTGKASVRVENERQMDVSLSSHTYNTMIDTYGKAGQIKEASDIFAEMLRKRILPTTVTFNTMIHICGNQGQLEEVALLMQKMEELRCPPDTRTYNILIFIHAKHNDINMAASYFKRMKKDQLQPDLVSYRTLLYAFSIRHMVNDAENLVSEMDEKGIEIDEYTQSALTRMYIEAGMLEKSWLWFWRFHLAGNMSSECYSANIDAYGERGHVKEAARVFACRLEQNKLTVLEFNVMIKAYGFGKNYEKACDLFDSMESHGVVPDKCSYSSLVQILASADLPDKAKHYLKKMQEAGLVSDCVQYCAVISSFVKLGKLEMAEEVYKEMVGFDVKPDIIVYGVLINAFADSGCVKEAISYIDAMKGAGLPGNTVIYNSLIKLYTKVGYLREAQETYKLLQSSDVGPETYSSNCMIDLYSEQSMVKPAEEIFESMKRKGDANEFTYAMMLCMYKRLGWFEQAIQIAKQMRELGLLTYLLSYNNVLGLYALDGRFKEAVGTFKEMVGAGIQPDDCTFKSLGIVLVKCGISKQAVGKLEATTKKDRHSGLQTWLAALSAVVEVDEDDDDVRLT
ncbi:pentatricopeptide repeat-containing protein, putative [Ricinus communis]|uniref:Pentatricopeptide repeat-containing protein, putative n=1 Tax=Ricinus communis TaxID=3988 RepID=B9RTG3_RICCO|nr:pentatricopeptide repeat-containing protein, putative [Ricinus communis]|eukprot:XP_002517032.1 pentatricopeptide repeat-containing protein At3g23020 [Ricinus communis]